MCCEHSIILDLIVEPIAIIILMRIAFIQQFGVQTDEGTIFLYRKCTRVWHLGILPSACEVSQQSQKSFSFLMQIRS